MVGEGAGELCGQGGVLGLACGFQSQAVNAFGAFVLSGVGGDPAGDLRQFSHCCAQFSAHGVGVGAGVEQGGGGGQLSQGRGEEVVSGDHIVGQPERVDALDEAVDGGVGDASSVAEVEL